MSFRFALSAFVAGASLVFGTMGAARAQPSDATQRARALFESGLARADQGDLLAALRDFEAAYAARPHFSVLYNIGQTRSTLGRAVEANAAFERYLNDGGDRVPDVRRREVEGIVAANRARIGRLRIVPAPGETVRVWLDGTELSTDQLGQPLPVVFGEHSIISSTAASPAESTTVEVRSNDLVELRLAPKLPAPSPHALLAITCGVPGVQVSLSGVEKFQTPLTHPLSVPAGSVEVRFSRPGYMPRATTVTTVAGRLSAVDCRLRFEKPLPPAVAAKLTVRTEPADAELTVDGQRYAGAALPAGPHYLQIQRDGFLSVQRNVVLVARKTNTFDVELQPTPANLQRMRRAQEERKTVALVLGGVGVAALATAAGVYAWNSGRYADWPSNQAQYGSKSEFAASIQRADDAAAGLLVMGVSLGVGAAWVFWSSN